VKAAILISVFLLSSCSQSLSDYEKGEILFNKTHVGQNNVIGCISCHSLSLETKTVGPSLFMIGKRADKMVKGLSAQQYIKQSIINPDAYIVNGYTPAVMFAHYSDELDESQIDNLVLFILNNHLQNK